MGLLGEAGSREGSAAPVPRRSPRCAGSSRRAWPGGHGRVAGGTRPARCAAPRRFAGKMRGVFLALSKVLDWLLAPLSWALLLLLLALVSRARPRRAFAATALAL